MTCQVSHGETISVVLYVLYILNLNGFDFCNFQFCAVYDSTYTFFPRSCFDLRVQAFLDFRGFDFRGF